MSQKYNYFNNFLNKSNYYFSSCIIYLINFGISRKIMPMLYDFHLFAEFRKICKLLPVINCFFYRFRKIPDGLPGAVKLLGKSLVIGKVTSNSFVFI